MKKLVVLFLVTVIGIFAVLPVCAAPFLGCAADVLSSDMTMVKTGLRGKKICFSEADFRQAMGVPTFTSVTVTALPDASEGTLLFAGRKVKEGQTVKRKNVASLCFVPASENVSQARFAFCSEGLLGGAQMTAILRFTDAFNAAPDIDKSGDALSVQTQENVVIYGNMIASDPENDRLEFIPISSPKHGMLTIVDKNTGYFRYMPTASYTGKDRFSFVVRDEYGNYSEPCNIEIRVRNRISDVRFSDMEDDPAYNAALALQAAGIMDGNRIGDDCLFLPDQTVTRAEFTAMALKSAGIRADSSLGATFFDDDATIPKALVGYVATAQRLGIVTGRFDGKTLNFRPNAPISRTEAALILSRLMPEKKDVPTVAISDGNSIPSYARASVNRCLAAGMFDVRDGQFLSSENVTRRDAAAALFRLSSIAR